ncbi:outer membrane protein assembly factor BamA [Roseomonas sp. CECT 9278]|uniref:outer membrane protein assembly factor BamA n=1 Tax=Roseomonas sp. CECT 9278 TaxID=2845823 RepID=UPI001E412010|nr:outer membrane protein assembly factor BamA [Roseomonas sp. CECT 9278]CAH0261580.1 Outer membrane protein assembly factor BamA [Roseomonas sp. CECT 9278]
MTRLRTLLLVLAALVLALPSSAQAPGRVATIEVQGNQRIEADTIRSYMLVQPGGTADPDTLDRSLRALFATGLFRDVEIRPEGNRVIVRVVENPLVNRVGFEGNRRVTSEVLRGEVQLRPRGVFTPAAAQADRQRILEIYARRGRFGATVEPKIIELDQNRVDVVFEITEGNVALVSRIGFVGNESYSDSRLKEIIATREQAWYRLLSTSDNYDPDRLAFDRELLRRFYLRQGYADVEITGATAELAPDRSGFFLTYTISEGPRYRIGNIEVTSSIRGLDPAGLTRDIPLSVGDWYDGDAVERADTQLTERLGSRGFPFANVEPRVVRNREARRVDLTFEITEGPRAFVERIEITGNTRTQDRVIRREFRLAEGDPLMVQQVRRSRERIRSLGFFSDVQINSAPGSSPDRVILNTQVTERATGEFTIGGGYSTDAGLLADIGLRERNLLGTGVDARLNVTLAQRRSQVDISVTDPQFLDRNLAAGADVFLVQRNLQETSGYDERRAGFALRMGYEINERLRQSWSYSLVDRELTDVDPNSSRFIQEQAGRTLLSQVSTTVTYDRRDSRVEPRSGYVVRGGIDWAGLGGDISFVRFRGDAQYYIPFERLLGDNDYVLVLAAGAGHLAPYGDNDTRIVDRFFLGGENLRGFALGGAGPRDISTNDALGGQTIWTSSAEFRFPLPLPAELGFIGRAFVDAGGNFGLPGSVNDTGCPTTFPNCVRDDASPRVGAGVGISWRSPIGLINIDLAQALVKKSYDETQVFRLGFGTRF